MGTYEELKAAIQQVIRTNGNNEITGALLQNVLLSIVNVVGANATFAGIATPNTNPGTADQNVFYLATEAGMYVNFDGIVINTGEAVILSNKTGSWVKTTSGFATEQQLIEFSEELTNLTDAINKIADSIESDNLLNPNDKDILIGYYQSMGKPVANASYQVTGYIKVTGGVSYYIRNKNYSQEYARFISFFNDDSDTPISSVENQYVLITPSGATRMRLTMPITSDLSSVMVGEGEVPGAFQAYGRTYTIKNDALPLIDTENIKDKSITLDKLSDDVAERLDVNTLVDKVIDTTNLVNNSDSDVKSGYLSRNGEILDNDNYITTGYIAVKVNKTYYLHASENNHSARFVLCYDNNKTPIANSLAEYIKEISIQDNVGFIRVTFSYANWNVAQVTENQLYTYRPYGIILGESVYFQDNSIPIAKVKGIESILSSQGGRYIKSQVNNLAEGAIFELSSAPKYIKRCNNISFSCQVSEFGNFYIGKGYQERSGVYLKVTSTQIQYIRYWNSETIIASVEHNLDMTDVKFVRISMIGNYEGELRVILSTNKGIFTDIQNTSYESAGKPFVKSESLSANDVILNYSNNQIKNSIWVVGDSYTSLTSDRWTGVLDAEGINRYLLLGISGGYSQQMFEDITKCLTLGTPKYIVWCLGMNDRGSGDYPYYLDKLIPLCAQREISLVLMKIPQVPPQEGLMSIEEAVNQYVISSGLPYIDAYAAVGANAEGVWYEGMLSSDNVHPTRLGAQAIASQVLVDFPQLLECVA